MESFNHNLDDITKGRWQWKSNKDPWSDEEPQWESYSPEHNYLIEKAYYDQKQEVILGEYIILIHHKVQMKTGDELSQRLIRRIDWMENIEEAERAERYYVTEKPNTFNNIFGSLKDFISFFSQRSPQIMQFVNQFNKFEESNDLNGLNNTIIPTLVEGLHEELIMPLEEQLNSDSVSKRKKRLLLKKKETSETLILSFYNEFSSFQKFYQEILKAYTMGTNLYINLNQYLRNESWIEINKLLPYACCLCKAFFTFERNKNVKKDPESILLYRGTAFDEKALSCYNRQKIQHFSWNSVTSTTTNKQVASNFMHSSADIQSKKYPVIFIIEVPIPENSTKLEYSRWIDVKACSDKPGEDEFVLPPGTAFELVEEPNTDENRITTIKLRLKNEVQSLAYQGFMMQGALQNQMLEEKEQKIMCLEGGELNEALNTISGNQLIEEIEFCFCIFDHKSLGKMIKVLPTLTGAKRLKFMFCSYQGVEDTAKFYMKDLQSSITSIQISERNNLCTMLSLNQEDCKYWKSLKELDMSFQSLRMIPPTLLCSEALKHSTQIQSLNLNFEDCYEMTDQAVDYFFAQGLQNFTQLTSLNLNFSRCKRITDQALKSLNSQGMTCLTQLELNFSICEKLTDESVENICSNLLQHLTQLNSLNLNFERCPKITELGVFYLTFQGLTQLPQLISLNLNLSSCTQITDQAVQVLCIEGLQNLPQLTSLSLDFSECSKITDDAVETLSKNEKNYLTRLTSLNLNFSSCSKVTNNGLITFCSKALEHLTQVTSLALDFSFCKEITDEGFNPMCTQGYQYLRKLTSLSLNFRKCSKITDEEISNLCDWLAYLPQLTYLDLNFEDCRRITSEGLGSLCDEVFPRLKQLTSLKLNFSDCLKIKDKGIKAMCSQGLPFLTQLKSLELKFSSCGQITNEEFHKLCLKTLKPLTQLKSLKINSSLWPIDWNKSSLNNETLKQIFPEGSPDQLVCRRIKNQPEKKDSNSIDQETKKLCDMLESMVRSRLMNSLLAKVDPQRKTNEMFINAKEPFLEDIRALEHYHIVKSLALYLFDCSEVTDEGVSNLCSGGLEHLTELEYLTLNFKNCHDITSQGINILCSKGLKYLTGLKSLQLNFDSCTINDEGLMYLGSQGLNFLPQLIYLKLDLPDCDDITDRGIHSLCSEGLANLTQLTALELSFHRCKQITDQGMMSFCTQGLKYLTKLETLDLNFSWCPELTDDGATYLCSQGLKKLVQLTRFSLDVSSCPQIAKFTMTNILRILYYYGFRTQKTKD